jgi:protein-disulfide isomerase
MSVPRATRTARQRRLAERAERRLAEPAERVRARHRRTASRLSFGTLSVLALVAGLAVVVLAIVLGTRPPPSSAERPAAVTVGHAPVGIPADRLVLGRVDAPVTIDLYEDFQCPACEAWGRTVFPSLATNELRTGIVKVVFHDMAFLGRESTDAGRAAYAAARQGRFWDMWATLYANQGRENSGAFSRARLMAMAGELDLDVARFETDMDSPAALASIDASRNEAGRAGVTSTPTMIVKGQRLEGLGSYEDLAAAIAGAAIQ